MSESSLFLSWQFRGGSPELEGPPWCQRLRLLPLCFHPAWLLQLQFLLNPTWLLNVIHHTYIPAGREEEGPGVHTPLYMARPTHREGRM